MAERSEDILRGGVGPAPEHDDPVQGVKRPAHPGGDLLVRAPGAEVGGCVGDGGGGAARADQGLPAPPLNVLEFPRTSLQDIPARLRRLADEIEEGTYGDVDSTAVVVSGQVVTVHGFGGTGLDHHCALMHAGALKLTRLVADHDKGCDHVGRAP